MPRIALISDIHYIIDALEAVLDDIKGQEVDEIVCLRGYCWLRGGSSGMSAPYQAAPSNAIDAMHLAPHQIMRITGNS